MTRRAQISPASGRPLQPRFLLQRRRLAIEVDGGALGIIIQTDSLYIELKAGPGSETREVAPGVNADLAADGTIVGLDIESASRP